MERIDKLMNLYELKEAIRNLVEKETGNAVNSERIDKFMGDIGKMYLKTN